MVQENHEQRMQYLINLRNSLPEVQNLPIPNSGKILTSRLISMSLIRIILFSSYVVNGIIEVTFQSNSIM
mgnify:CR=1 FL=1